VRIKIKHCVVAGPRGQGRGKLGGVKRRQVLFILPVVVALTIFLYASRAGAAGAGANPAFTGDWVINQDLSDDTDKKVENAIRAAGGKPDSGGRKGRGRYRGGPKEEELYDRMSYDDVLNIRIAPPKITFTYADGFTRVFYTDGRGRTVSATGEKRDYSFGGWGNGKLSVESVPRDGGWTREEYTLQAGGNRLRAELHLKPLTFMGTINIVRIYDRKGTVQAPGDTGQKEAAPNAAHSQR
jgi:hypothetical protein